MSQTPSTPGSQALVNYQNRNVVEFKKPTKEAVKKKPKILTEEKYIEEISRIIQRDFFPDLEKLRAQNDYLDAMERKDYVQMQAIRAKYSGLQHSERARSMTPATFETPETATSSTPRPNSNTNDGSDTPKSTTSNATCTSKVDDTRNKSISEKHSLDSFLQAYTSEDNYSFQEIVDAAEEKLRQKFAVLYNEERISNEQLAKALTLPSIEQQFDQPDPMRKIETWTYKNKNSIMYIPDGVELTKKEQIELVNRKQQIQYSATRLQSNPFEGHQQISTETSKSQMPTSTQKVGVDGNILAQDKPAPQIRGFDLVKTPSPKPGEAFSPIMTWGEIEGTPFRLDGSDTPVRSNAGPSFRINETSRRENIALALAEKVGEKMRAQKQRAKDAARKNVNSPFIRTNMERLASMSPAARRLATNKLGLRTPLMTPTPTRTPVPMTRKRKSETGSAKSTPIIPSKVPAYSSNRDSNATTSAGTTTTTKKTLTDDLLKIPTKPKRPSAADFF